jgi:hypothetical protein
MILEQLSVVPLISESVMSDDNNTYHKFFIIYHAMYGYREKKKNIPNVESADYRPVTRIEIIACSR